MNTGNASASARPLRIFVVENHPDTLKYLRMYLESKGYEVESARTMQGALAALPAANSDVLLSDIGLTDGDGWELLRQVLRVRPIYAIAMSGMGMGLDRTRSLEAGYRHHLLKPYSPDELDGMLEEAASELRVGP